MLRVYGTELSYFTGKFEMYLRYKEIAYERRELDMFHYLWKVPRKLGATQYPSVELPDGRWMSDTTPMIAWLEEQHPEWPVLPDDPETRFLALLLEDFGDEWLWRPAMHFRWNNEPDAYSASTSLARGILNISTPLWSRRLWIARRQRSKFVTGDGVVDARTRRHMDDAYVRVLDRIEPGLSRRPFLLGDRPTIADFGLLGSMFRHFSNDPTPARIMRDRAPATWEWVARVWNTRGSELAGELPAALPGDLDPLLDEIGQTHLRALAANADAHNAGRSRHDFRVQGVSYRDVPTSAYRVWVLEQLRARFEALPDDLRPRLEALLRSHDCWVPIWSSGPTDSGHDPGGTAPFCRTSRMVRD